MRIKSHLANQEAYDLRDTITKEFPLGLGTTTTVGLCLDFCPFAEPLAKTANISMEFLFVGTGGSQDGTSIAESA
jgi:hypothetical protein